MLSKERPRIESIQVIRAIAFMLIFLSHVELTSTGPIGVSLFLVLSGFCMTYAYLDRPEKTPTPSLRNNLRFAWGKVKKLYPLHVITLLFVALVIFGGLILHKGSGKEIAEQGGYFVANAMLLQSWIPWRDGYFSFNAVSWYLSTSVFSYFIFLWVFRAIQSKDKKRITRLAGITLALMVLVAIILGIGQRSFSWTKALIKWVVYICPLYRAGDFVIGLVAGYIFVSTQKSLNGGGDSHNYTDYRNRVDDSSGVDILLRNNCHKLDSDSFLAPDKCTVHIFLCREQRIDIENPLKEQGADLDRKYQW